MITAFMSMQYRMHIKVAIFKRNLILEMLAVEEILINGNRYAFIKEFKDNVLLRNSYNALTKKTYGFDFEKWYQGGYWGSSYKPYSMMNGKNIVANVSASIMDCLVLGKSKKLVQIGTVMTDPAYRNQGLSRYLIEKVIGEWNGRCDMIFLFANDSVLNFYPKFGFEAVSEYQYFKEIKVHNDVIAAEKIDMSIDYNRKLVAERAAHSIPVSKLSVLKNAGLVMFYCTTYIRNKVYYLKEQDVIAIAEYNGDTLYLYDIFSMAKIDLDDVIKSLTNKNVKKVVLGFTPYDINGYHETLLQEEDTTLFVMKDKADLFKNNKLMFPVLSHA